MKLKNKVALITGASRGIGRSIAQAFAQEGAIVIINYFRSAQKAIELFETIKDAGQTAFVIKADMSKLQEISLMVFKIIKEHGRIDILVNNASMYSRNKFLDSTEEIWDLTMNTNLRSAFFCSKLVAQQMLKQKSGTIINIASNAGLFPKQKTGIEYGISKCGVIYLTKSLALTLAPDITVNCIAPGYTSTEMASFYNDPELKAKIAKSIPLGRVNDPEEIAKGAVFLASEDAKNITGQVLVIDGGFCLK